MNLNGTPPRPIRSCVKNGQALNEMAVPTAPMIRIGSVHNRSVVAPTISIALFALAEARIPSCPLVARVQIANKELLVARLENSASAGVFPAGPIHETYP